MLLIDIMVFKKLFALLSLSRPLDWSKSFSGMVLGYITALFVLGKTASFDLQLFITGLIIICPLLFGGLYVLNDWTDWKKDQKHSAKKERAIASGKIKPSLALAFGVFLVVLAFGFGFFLNNALLLACMALMLVNQWFYTMEPFYFKRRAIIDLVTGAIILSALRFIAGWALATQSLVQLPWSMIIFVIAIQYVFYSLFRLSSRDLEKELGFKSSVVLFNEKTVIGSSILAFTLAIIAYAFASITILQEKFLIPLFLSGLLLPWYMKALEDPEHIQFKKMKRIVYLHFYGFAIIFAAVFFL